MFFINEVCMNDTTIEDDVQVCHDVFEITDADGEEVDVLRIPVAEEPEPYLAALEEAGWHFVSDVDWHGGEIAKN